MKLTRLNIGNNLSIFGRFTRWRHCQTRSRLLWHLWLHNEVDPPQHWQQPIDIWQVYTMEAPSGSEQIELVTEILYQVLCCVCVCVCVRERERERGREREGEGERERQRKRCCRWDPLPGAVYVVVRVCVCAYEILYQVLCMWCCVCVQERERERERKRERGRGAVTQILYQVLCM